MNRTGKQITKYVGVFALFVAFAVPVEANLTGDVHPGRAGSRPAESKIPELSLDTAATLSFTALGGPMIGSSWDALFFIHAPTSFSHLGVVVGPGGELEGAPSMFSFADLGGPLGWSQFFGPGPGLTGSTALSFGTATNDLFWAAHFTGDDPSAQAFSMNLFSFNDIGENVWDGAIANWDGSAWTVGGVPDLSVWQEFRGTIAGGTIETVPLPSAALLGALGLGCVATLRKRLL